MIDGEIKPISETPEGVVKKPSTPEEPEVQIEAPEALEALRTEAEQGIADLARTDIQATRDRVEQTTSLLGLGSEEGKIMTERQTREIREVE
jgi:hypothetical protein